MFSTLILNPSIRNQDFGPIAVSWIIHAYINYINAPYMGTFGKTFKMAPSKVHRSSHVSDSLYSNSARKSSLYRCLRSILQQIEMYWQFTKEKDLLSDSVYWNIQGVMQNIGVSTNTTMLSWNVQANIHFGQFSNHVKLLLSRKTTGEKNLNVISIFR